MLKKAGFKNFEKIANAKISRFNAILTKAGYTGKVPYVKSWSSQAKLARAGQWSELVKAQKKLKKG